MATRGQFNSRSPTIKRIMKEAAELTSTPSPDFTATPLDDNLFEWHFTLRGPPGSSPPLNPSNPSQASSSSTPPGVFSDGIYHGRIVLPPTYPLRPPSFRFFTPSGRFECNREICLSISGHHEETWQPAWGLRTALVALRTFMETDAKGQLGGLDSSDDVRRRLAGESRNWKCGVCGKSNLEIIRACEEATKEAEERGEDIKEETVPDELKLAYTDELGKSMDTNGKENEEDNKITAELAEGFVQTTTTATPLAQVQNSPNLPTQPQSQQHHQPVLTYPEARPAQSVPQPTAPIRTIHLPPHAETIQTDRSNNGVPAWLDKLIAINVAFLVFLVFRWVLMT